MLIKNVRCTLNRFSVCAGILLAALLARAQTVAIPQIVDGGGWQTTIVLTNTTANPAIASLSFYQETSGNATQSWNLPLLESVSLQNLSLAAGGTMFLHTPGTNSGNTTGWGSLQGSGGVQAYAIYTYRTPGHQDQDVTASGVTGAERVLVPFDNTSGLATGVALVNPTGSSESVSVLTKTDTGETSTTVLPSIPALGHASFLVTDKIGAIANKRGLAEFYTTGGTLAMIAIRANSTLAFTSAPVYHQSGTPILGGGTGSPGGGGGTLPTFGLITISGTLAASDGSSYHAALVLTSATQGGYASGALALTSLTYPSPKVFGVAAGWNNIAVSGQTYTFNGLLGANTSYMLDNSGIPYGITSANLTITLTPGGAPTTGTASGSVSLTSGLATLTGTLTGAYLAN
ncbi:MAG TPA: hypothetical protein VGF16_18175 [Bryobacteraceae bacterium]|jgi:hypothetical protein